MVPSEIHAVNLPEKPAATALFWQSSSAACTLPIAPAYVVDVTKTRFCEGPGSGGAGVELEPDDDEEASDEPQPPPLDDE